jgi:hypothetical protein
MKSQFRCAGNARHYQILGSSETVRQFNAPQLRKRSHSTSLQPSLAERGWFQKSGEIQMPRNSSVGPSSGNIVFRSADETAGREPGRGHRSLPSGSLRRCSSITIGPLGSGVGVREGVDLNVGLEEVCPFTYLACLYGYRLLVWVR